MQSKNKRYYTEAQANARAEEIAAEKLAGIIEKCDRIMQGFLLANSVNSALHKQLTKAEARAEAMTRAAVCYEETVERLPAEMQKEFKKINKEMMNSEEWRKYGL